MLGQRIAARQPPPISLPELRRALLDEWCNIPQDQIDNLILSMPRRWTRRRERTLTRWLDNVEKDLKLMEISRWTVNRRRISESALACKRLLCS
ncbi:transposable element Tcb2 transposase [Trichonephila clavipes]|nr:transposable element Tcb2 transposase [Trichonephila clavipes]